MPTRAQASQPRSQPSQQSMSQGISSQHGMFSQLSQTSLDEAPTNDQRFNFQERENSVKRMSCLPPVSYTHEESQMPISRSSTNLMRKWHPAPIPDHKCQISEELEHRIGMIETSLNKFGMILDSIQGDVMQVNKGTKEVALEIEGMRQKLIVLDGSLQLMNKGQEDVKLCLDGSIKSISEQMSQDTHQDKLQHIFLVLSTLPEHMEASLKKSQDEFCLTLTKEMQAMASSMKALTQNSPSITVLPPKVTGSCATPQMKSEPLNNAAMPAKIRGQATVVPRVEMGGWNSVKSKKARYTRKTLQMEQKQKVVPSIQQHSMRQEKQHRVIIDSDEEIHGGFSCLIDEEEAGTRNNMIDEAKEETERILRKARRQKRKYCNPIIIS